MVSSINIKSQARTVSKENASELLLLYHSNSRSFAGVSRVYNEPYRLVHTYQIVVGVTMSPTPGVDLRLCLGLQTNVARKSHDRERHRG